MDRVCIPDVRVQSGESPNGLLSTIRVLFQIGGFGSLLWIPSFYILCPPLPTDSLSSFWKILLMAVSRLNTLIKHISSNNSIDMSAGEQRER